MVWLTQTVTKGKLAILLATQAEGEPEIYYGELGVGDSITYVANGTAEFIDLGDEQLDIVQSAAVVN